MTVNSLSALEDAASSASAGDTICLENGTYVGDFELSLSNIGTAEAPVTIAAENPGQVIITGGEGSINISGEYIVFQGFVFREGNAFSLQFDRSSRNCRVTEISVIDMDQNDPYGSSKWIEIDGINPRVDHSWFSGKTTRGALMLMGRWAEVFDAASIPPEFAQIDHNYFGDRAPAFGKAYAGSGDNEYEGVRLGLSFSHHLPSYSTLEYNYFGRVQGEAEVISNKAAGNIIRYNTVRDSNGSIVTRHGGGVTFDANVVIGDDNPFSGGIRIVDGEHIVTNNYVEGARYLNSNWNGGIILTTGNSSGDGDNGYQNVENVLVAHNTIVDSVNSLNVSGGRENTLPSEVYFVNNIIDNAVGPVVRTNGEAMPSGSVFDSNYVSGQSFSDDAGLTSYAGLEEVDALLTPGTDNLFRKSTTSPDLTANPDAFTGDFALPESDMDGQTRSSASNSGADEVLSTEASIGILTPELVGPISYRPEPGIQHIIDINIENHDFDSGDLTGWDNNGGLITTLADEVFSRGSSAQLGSSSSLSQTVTIEPNTHYTASAFINGTGQLAVTVDGQTYSIVAENSSYGFESLYFNSGTASEATINLSIAGAVDNQAVTDSNFTDFRAGGDAWTTVEGDDAGDVGSSSNTASGSDGSAKLGYTRPSHANTSPSISQTRK